MSSGFRYLGSFLICTFLRTNADSSSMARTSFSSSKAAAANLEQFLSVASSEDLFLRSLFATGFSGDSPMKSSSSSPSSS